MQLTSRCTLMLALFLIPTSVFGADQHRLQTTPHITTLTVYPDQFITARSAALSLKSGNYQVLFENIHP